MPLTYQAAANPPPLAFQYDGEAPLQVPVVAFLIVCNRSPLIAVSHPQFTQHAQFTARRPPSDFVLIAPAGVRPSVILAFLGCDPRQRARNRAEDVSAAGGWSWEFKLSRRVVIHEGWFRECVIHNQFGVRKVLHQVARGNRVNRLAYNFRLKINRQIVLIIHFFRTG